MKWLTFGFWDTLDETLRSIGKSATWFLVRKPGRGVENADFAITGGALVCAVFGGLVGFTLSDLSRSIATMAGAIVGGLLGACMGVFFGSVVETVDDTIKDLLRSLNSK